VYLEAEFADENKTSIHVKGTLVGVDGGSITILVVRSSSPIDNTIPETLDDENVIYVNQKDVFNGEAEWTFLIRDTSEGGNYITVFMGGTGVESFAYKQLIIEDEIPDVLLGDVNGDEEIDFADAILVLKYDAGIFDISEDYLSAADVNGDEDVDFADAILILKYDAGLIASFN
ncbi:MAG: dockerin type I repeat-containing protein, partial [Clostridia bacterium]|nr:dockerin type I repeat-containing protein [Clostridia bacterium]